MKIWKDVSNSILALAWTDIEKVYLGQVIQLTQPRFKLGTSWLQI